jgi:hypothetical protein
MRLERLVPYLQAWAGEPSGPVISTS